MFWSGDIDSLALSRVFHSDVELMKMGASGAGLEGEGSRRG